MRIRVTTAFLDRQETDPEKSEVAADSVITVTAERGAELIALGLAVENDAKSESTSTTKQ